MATFKWRGFDRVSRRVGNTMAQMIRASGMLEDIAEDVIKDIQKGTEPKTQTKSNPKGQPFKPLSKSTIARRKRLKPFNEPLDAKYKASKSNLTFTGQLVRSIKAKIIRSKGIIIIQATGNRKPYIGVRGKPLKGEKSNAKLALHHKKMGRDIVSIGRYRVEQIKKQVERGIRRLGFS
jgi:hypothetical protein